MLYGQGHGQGQDQSPGAHTPTRKSMWEVDVHRKELKYPLYSTQVYSPGRVQYCV